MKHEFKIIMKFDDSKPTAVAPNTTVYLDDEPVGVIQEFKFQVSTDQFTPQLEITFPNLESPKIDPSYKKLPNLISTVKAQIERLKIVPNIKVVLKEIF